MRFQRISSLQVRDAADAVTNMAEGVVAAVRGGKQSPVVSCNREIDLYHTKLAL